ncbi:hypothetical protein [Halalkalibacter urbisdiaboli]|uniref:hypothetical protein n=1 Tax=Halalkalibacter urbisdiaboli TaxID=1960589 RepID=UPI000B42D35C|nr:hypothetical protein [Halalkalibacter urbisdiaboli]
MFELVLGVIVIIVIFSLLKRRSRRVKLQNEPLPSYLGVQIAGGVAIVQQLERTLSSSYVNQVRNRVEKEHRKINDYVFDWTFFELKRYFFMNSLLKSVPMFSARVDTIWHEMLMFTREYETFSNNMYGELLHHTPNIDSKPNPGERAFFDWMYLRLFKYNVNSKVIWGRFLQNPIKREILDDFRELSEEKLLNKYFRKNEEWIEVKKNIIRMMKDDISQADSINRKGNPIELPQGLTEAQMYHSIIGVAVYLSIYESDHYNEQMSQLLPMEYYKTVQSGGGSSCYSYGCSSSSKHDSDGGGDSGGDSSCSSCGGGCSS